MIEEYKKIKELTIKNNKYLVKMQVVDNLMAYDKFLELNEGEQAKIYNVIYDIYMDTEEFTIVDITEILFNNYVDTDKIELGKSYKEIREFLENKMEIY